MKSIIFLCALALSTAIPNRGWCASNISPKSAHHVVSSQYQHVSGTMAAIPSGSSAINARASSNRSGDPGASAGDPASRAGADEMRIILIVCCMAAYLIALVSWTVSAKGSLDRVLKHVTQSMARY